LAALQESTGRNVIAYYSAWLTKSPQPQSGLIGISDNDKNALMATVHELDRNLGLDLILHTPGGDVAAVESIAHYLRQMFGTDIRAIIPQLAMSGGTMLACACKQIVMGKHSNLGPIDPQIGGIPANGVLKEFEQAKREVKKDPAAADLWRIIIGRYHPTFLGECRKAVDWSQQIVREWLETGMLAGDKGAKAKARRITSRLFKFGDETSHGRHLHVDDCEKFGLKVVRLETAPDDLQDKVLTVHHAFMHTLANTAAVKITESHLGRAMILNARPS
jgi:hypothetical protein